jgi:uncharacterized protein HemY
VNPQTTRLRVDELEEEIRSSSIPDQLIPEKLAELGDLHVQLQQREKALDYLRRALVAKGGPDASLLNKMGITYGELGDVKRQEKCYEEAALASRWAGPLFNLALARNKRRDFAGAAAALDRALAQDRSAPYLLLRADVAKAVGDETRQFDLRAEAFSSVGPIDALNDWELGWILYGAKTAGRAELLEAAQAELAKRQGRSTATEPAEGRLPEITPALVEHRS